MRRLCLLTFVVATSGCFKGWDLGGPWACSAGEVCPEGYACDEGICCVPGGSPSCPTRPFNNQCPSGEPLVFFRDEDGDGEGNEKVRDRFCRQPSSGKWVLTASDCDDTRVDVNSGAMELCNGLDDNCDGVIDDGLPGNPTFYRDEDGDLFGNAALQACVAPEGYVALGGDCDDLSPGRKPNAPELCNNFDDNCNNVSDVAETVFIDADDDTSRNFPCDDDTKLGECRAGTIRCESNGQLVGRVCRGIARPQREICDGLDNDCDGTPDNGPDCGGPRDVFTTPGLVFQAKHMASTSQLNTSCQMPLAGTPETVSANNRTWTGTAGSNYHVYSFSKADAGTWDLSNLGAQLKLSMSTSTTGWNPEGSVHDPVVYLCGTDPSQFIRIRTANGADGVFDGVTTFTRTLTLNDPGANGWLIGVGSGFDTSNVSRVEVLVFNTGGFTVTFNELGFGP